MLEFLSNLYEDTYYRIGVIKFSKEKFIHSLAISLYATIIEQTGSAIALLKAEKYAGVDVILRSMLEAYVDLRNLLANPDYLKNMRASYHKEWLKLYTNGVSGNNAYLQFFQKPEMQQNIKFHEDGANQLKSEGIKVLQVAERFEKAGMADVYTSVYNALCTESHNNIRALTARHIRIKDEAVEVVMFQKPPASSIAATISSFTGIYIDAGGLTHAYFDSPAEAVFKHYETEMRKHPDF